MDKSIASHYKAVSPVGRLMSFHQYSEESDGSDELVFNRGSKSE